MSESNQAPHQSADSASSEDAFDASTVEAPRDTRDDDIQFSNVSFTAVADAAEVTDDTALAAKLDAMLASSRGDIVAAPNESEFDEGSMDAGYAANRMKAWHAIQGGQNPRESQRDTQAFWSKPVTDIELQSMMLRFCTFVIWNASDLSAPSQPMALTLDGASDRFNVDDRGTCIVMHPKSLYDTRRGFNDAISTVRAMAQHVFALGWDVEFSGLDRLASVAWVELKFLSNTLSRLLIVNHFEPLPADEAILQDRLNKYSKQQDSA